MSKTPVEKDMLFPPPEPEPREYFRSRLPRAARFCSQRFPQRIEFAGKEVLDVGCGYGALSVHAAQQGAARVQGIDPDPASIGIAREIQADEYPELASKVTFTCGEVRDLGATAAYDVAVSFAALEHVVRPEELLRDVRRALKPGGRFYLGFGPLYRSPWGDHRRTLVPFNRLFPWAHLLFPEKWIVARHNRKRPEQPISRIGDLGLNCLRLADYVDAFDESGFRVEHLRVNQHENRLVMRAMDVLRGIPGFDELLIYNVYCVLATAMRSSARSRPSDS